MPGTVLGLGISKSQILEGKIDKKQNNEENIFG